MKICSKQTEGTNNADITKNRSKNLKKKKCKQKKQWPQKTCCKQKQHAAITARKWCIKQQHTRCFYYFDYVSLCGCCILFLFAVFFVCICVVCNFLLLFIVWSIFFLVYFLCILEFAFNMFCRSCLNLLHVFTCLQLISFLLAAFLGFFCICFCACVICFAHVFAASFVVYWAFAPLGHSIREI